MDRFFDNLSKATHEPFEEASLIKVDRAGQLIFICNSRVLEDQALANSDIWAVNKYCILIWCERFQKWQEKEAKKKKSRIEKESRFFKIEQSKSVNKVH